MRYFKRYWNEPRGDSHDDWGCSWWYFETDEAGVVERQVEVYDSGPTLRYDQSRQEDEYGGLSEKPLDIADFEAFEVNRDDFEQAWGQ
jgi:hypothetical protein